MSNKRYKREAKKYAELEEELYGLGGKETNDEDYSLFEKELASNGSESEEDNEDETYTDDESNEESDVTTAPGESVSNSKNGTYTKDESNEEIDATIEPENSVPNKKDNTVKDVDGSDAADNKAGKKRNKKKKEQLEEEDSLEKEEEKDTEDVAKDTKNKTDRKSKVSKVLSWLSTVLAFTLIVGLVNVCITYAVVNSLNDRAEKKAIEESSVMSALEKADRQEEFDSGIKTLFSKYRKNDGVMQMQDSTNAMSVIAFNTKGEEIITDMNTFLSVYGSNGNLETFGVSEEGLSKLASDENALFEDYFYDADARKVEMETLITKFVAKADKVYVPKNVYGMDSGTPRTYYYSMDKADFEKFVKEDLGMSSTSDFFGVYGGAALNVTGKYRVCLGVSYENDVLYSSLMYLNKEGYTMLFDLSSIGNFDEDWELGDKWYTLLNDDEKEEYIKGVTANFRKLLNDFDEKYQAAMAEQEDQNSVSENSLEQ